MYAEDEARLLLDQAATSAQLDDLVAQRVGGLPLEHVLGWVEFGGLRIEVDPGVFVPRRRTELLASQAAGLALARAHALVVDMCCGAGAVGAVVASSVDPVELVAADVDPAAVACARRNLRGRGQVYLGDLFGPLPPELVGRVDVVAANVPYVPTGSIALMPPEARDHEPRIALDGGADGLDVLRRLAAEAPRWLAPGGHLLVETSQAQAPTATYIARAAGLEPHLVSREAIGATVMVATQPGPAL